MDNNCDDDEIIDPNYPLQEEIPEYEEAKNVEAKVGPATVSLRTELKFAHTLWLKARDGFDDPPPPPPMFLENGKQLKTNWEQFKVTNIGIIEKESTPEEEKAFIKDFLSCATAVYMDLMCSIYEIFFEGYSDNFITDVTDDTNYNDRFVDPSKMEWKNNGEYNCWVDKDEDNFKKDRDR